jgi:hypothetical protein
MPRFSLNQTILFQSAGSTSRPSWTSGLLPSRVAHVCVWELSESDPCSIEVWSETNVVDCSLAWSELRLGFAHVFRKFDLDPKGQL